VRVISSGLCHTDLVTRDGYYTIPLPCVLGHEGAGIVEAVGSQCTHVPQTLIPRIIELYLQDRFPIDRLIRYYTLDEMNQAAADSERGTVIRAVLRPNGS